MVGGPGHTTLKMASPRTITIVALSFALGLFFVFMGTIKLTPRLSKDAYSEMVSKPLASNRICSWKRKPLFWLFTLSGSNVLCAADPHLDHEIK